MTLYFYSLYFYSKNLTCTSVSGIPILSVKYHIFRRFPKSLPFDNRTERLVRLLCRFSKSVCFSWLVFLKLQLTNKLANMEHSSWLIFKLGTEPDPLSIKFYWVLFKEIAFVKLNIFFLNLWIFIFIYLLYFTKCHKLYNKIEITQYNILKGIKHFTSHHTFSNLSNQETLILQSTFSLQEIKFISNGVILYGSRC